VTLFIASSIGTQIENCVNEWEDGKYEPKDFTEKDYKSTTLLSSRNGTHIRKVEPPWHGFNSVSMTRHGTWALSVSYWGSNIPL
jgi:hypothetical protein